MKKLITTILTFLLISNSALAFYTDVPTSHKYYDSIKTLYDAGLLPDETALNPDETLKYADYYKFILAFAQVDLSTSINLPYSNTDNFADYAKYLQTAINYKILNAPAGEFNFSRTISKKMALSMLFKLFGIGINYFPEQSTFPFTDIKIISDTAGIAMKTLELGIVEEKNPTHFNLAKRLSIAEFIDYFYKVREYAPETALNLTISTESIYSKTEKELLDNDNFDVLLDIWTKLQTDYYYKNDLEDDTLILGAIRGLVEEIEDLYTVFQEGDDAEKFFQSLSNEYEGVGMTVEEIDGKAIVISPFKESPAEKTGLKPNDIIIEVDGENVIDQTLLYIVNKIKGPAGSKVKITVLRGQDEFEFEITRESIIYENIQYELLKKSGKEIGYIEIITFGTTVYDDFVNAAEKLIEKKPDGFIIDMRNNPGGYMDAAINIAGLFADESIPVVYLEYSNGKKEEYSSDGNGLLKDYEIVILINEGSASASEILAGALQDHNLATVVGVNSFGKATVQSLINYSNGSLFKYTISKWLTPLETDIDANGITPDIEIENDGDTDAQLNRAVKEI